MDEQQQQQQLAPGQISNGLWAIAYTLIIVPLDAFLVWLLWGFFVVPLGVVAINFWWAMGLSIFVTYMLITNYGTVRPHIDARKAFVDHMSTITVVLLMSILARFMMVR